MLAFNEIQGLLPLIIGILYVLGMVKDIFGKAKTEDAEPESKPTATPTPKQTSRKRGEPPRPPRTDPTNPLGLPPIDSAKVPPPVRKPPPTPTPAPRPVAKRPEPVPVPTPVRASKPVARKAPQPQPVTKPKPKRESAPRKVARSKTPATKMPPTPTSKPRRRRRPRRTEEQQIRRLLESPKALQAVLQLNEILAPPVALRESERRL